MSPTLLKGWWSSKYFFLWIGKAFVWGLEAWGLLFIPGVGRGVEIWRLNYTWISDCFPRNVEPSESRHWPCKEVTDTFNHTVKSRTELKGQARDLSVFLLFGVCSPCVHLNTHMSWRKDLSKMYTVEPNRRADQNNQQPSSNLSASQALLNGFISRWDQIWFIKGGPCGW